MLKDMEIFPDLCGKTEANTLFDTQEMHTYNSCFDTLDPAAWP